MFGERPELSARIKTTDRMYGNVAGILGPLIGPIIQLRYGYRAVFYISAAVTAVIMAVQSTIPETLTPEARKPFSLKSANPIGNFSVLISNGRGLRGLSFSTILWFCCQSIWSTQAAFRFGVLGWTPTNDSHVAGLQSGVGVAAQGLLVLPALRRLGNRACFGLGALVSAVAYLIQSQSWRAEGASRHAVYLAGILLLKTLPDAMPEAMRAMIVSQGIATSGTLRSFLLLVSHALIGPCGVQTSAARRSMPPTRASATSSTLSRPCCGATSTPSSSPRRRGAGLPRSAQADTFS